MSLLNNKKGKWIVGGICAFALVATASTGLAAWVIGQNVPDYDTGNIGIQTEVLDSSVTVTLDDAADKSVYFGPNAGGSLITPDDGAEEDLNFTVKGTVSYNSSLISVTGVRVAIDDVYSLPAFANGYIDLPAEFVKETVNVDESTTKDIYVTTIPCTTTFEKEFSFRWGTKSGGVNPCDYFTDYATGKAYLDELSALANTLTFNFTVSPIVG